jgi:hypothetical protein
MNPSYTYPADASHIDAIATKSLWSHSWSLQTIREWFDQPRGTNGRYGAKPQTNVIACYIFMVTITVLAIYHWIVFKMTYGIN